MEPMKSQKRVAYSREFKLEAVKLVRAGKKPVTQIARELGVTQQLHAWVRLVERREGARLPTCFLAMASAPRPMPRLLDFAKSWLKQKKMSRS